MNFVQISTILGLSKKMKSEEKHEKDQSNFGMAGLGKYCNHYFKNHVSWDTLYIMKIYLSSIYTLLVWMFVYVCDR